MLAGVDRVIIDETIARPRIGVRQYWKYVLFELTDYLAKNPREVDTYVKQVHLAYGVHEAFLREGIAGEKLFITPPAKRAAAYARINVETDIAVKPTTHAIAAHRKAFLDRQCRLYDLIETVALVDSADEDLVGRTFTAIRNYQPVISEAATCAVWLT